jgi:phage host-nuclease inhibitor protein Gam
MEKTINLEELIYKYCEVKEDSYLEVGEIKTVVCRIEDVISMMREFSDQVIDLCVENAKTDHSFTDFWVDKDSILNTKSQIA